MHAEPPETSLGSSSTPVSVLKERRFKLSRACDRCRKRRIKCDEGHPCQACLTTNSACTFEEPGKKIHPQKSKRTATLEDRMHYLETLIKAIPPSVFAAGGAIPQSPCLISPDLGNAPFLVAPFTNPGVPPPSLHDSPLVNPSTHFSGNGGMSSQRMYTANAYPFSPSSIDQLSDETARMSLCASYLYFADEGYTRWQGETSGLPVLDLLVERHQHATSQISPDNAANVASAANTWFPDRQPRRSGVNPQSLWRLVTSYIVPTLMDSLVQCYLSTSYYILPFLHVPTFLIDYGNPQKWAVPGFAAFIVAICCLSSRHMDDARVRSEPKNGISAGTQWFELFKRLCTLPIADIPTLYNIQANLIAAVYAIGSGKLTKASALFPKHALCVWTQVYTDEVRKRTFWCVYIWDKQMSAHFGRPSILRLRDCDVGEPAPVDDEYITRESIGTPPPGTECRMCAFIVAVRIMVVLESVLDVPPARMSEDPTSFLLRATNVLSGARRFKEMREEEALLDEVHRSIPGYWSHTPETLSSEDTIRLTQAVRLHCAEHLVRLLIYRHRFSELIAERTNGVVPDEQTNVETAALIAAHNSAVQIIAANVDIAKKGLMTYYGVHVIHQLTQAGRTLVAVALSCKTEALQPLMPPTLDSLRYCVQLLKIFSSRYVCGLRSGDLMEEFCRLTGIPLESSHQDTHRDRMTGPPWIRPVRKKGPSSVRSNRSNSPTHSTHQDSPDAFPPSEFFADSTKLIFTSSSANRSTTPPHVSTGNPTFLDPVVLLDNVQNETQLYMSPEMYREGGIDMTALFHHDYLHTPTQAGRSPVEEVNGLPGPDVSPQSSADKRGYHIVKGSYWTAHCKGSLV